MAGNQANAMRSRFLGFPVWGNDTDGYLGAGKIDEERYARWLQWSAWNGLFEVKIDGAGGQGEDRPPWKYSEKLQQENCLLRVHVHEEALCAFSYSLDGKTYIPIGKPFKATPGTWIGAKVGLFSFNPDISDSSGYADFDWFRF
jgi:hypothetical protein